MMQVYDNVKSGTGEHLTYEERIKIEAYKASRYSNHKIARMLYRTRKLLTTLITRGAVRTIKQRQTHNNKIHGLLKHKTDVFFARSYASYKRGTKENHHKLIRRFIPKNKRLDEISTQTIN